MILSDFSVRGYDEVKVVIYRQMLEEGWARKLDFTYPPFKTDPTPQVILLGKWTHPSTGNNLVGGINLNYLNQSQFDRLRKALPKLLRSGRSLRTRYRWGKRYLPDIFKNFYRTYRSDMIAAVSPSTLRFWNPKADKKRKEEPLPRPIMPPPEKKAVQQAVPATTAQAAKQIAQQQGDLGTLGPQGSQLPPPQVKPTQQELDRDDAELIKTDTISKSNDIEQPEELENPEQVSADISKKLANPDELGEGYYHDKDIGYVWSTPESYIYWHSLPNFKKIDEGAGEMVVIKNVREHKIIYDRDNYHRMILEANWNYSDVIILNERQRIDS